jgi:hypothetical protein
MSKRFSGVMRVNLRIVILGLLGMATMSAVAQTATAPDSASAKTQQAVTEKAKDSTIAAAKKDAKPLFGKKEAGAKVDLLAGLSTENPPSADLIKIKIPAGVIYGTFTKDDGPFLIEGSVIVPSGQTLEFGPGSKIYIGGKYSTITVFGQLTAKGTAEQPILFRSINEKPNPWDWDRIYCRSKMRSTFEYCVIRDCNYGLYIENGLASVSNCLFEHNSLHGLVVANSAVTAKNCAFKNGHVLAVFCEPGSQLTAESLQVVDNITGIACTEKSLFRMNGGTVRGNTNGIAFMDGASMSMVGAEVVHNVNGMLAAREIPKNMREMIYENSVDVKIATNPQMMELLKAPQEVKSIVLPKAKSTITVAEGFQSGFSALKAPQEPAASFLGNVSAGFKYFSPTSIAANDTFVKQTKYLGEQSDKWYAGIQPETQLFLSGRRAGADINLLADFYGNQWNNLRKNVFNLSLNYVKQAIIIGDFYENGNETSISNRQLTGLKFTGELMDMGRGEKRLEYRLAAGESEIPKETGQHSLDLFNDSIQSGMSKRQQLTYVAGIAVKPTLWSKIIVKGIISQDQTDKALFRDEVFDPAIGKPVHAQTGCIGGEMALLDGKMSVNAELDMGIHDSLAENAAIAWYQPNILQSVGKVFSVIPDGDHYAFMADLKEKFTQYDLSLSYLDIGPRYFSAGNPYLEADRRKLALTSEKQFNEKVSAKAEYDFEQTAVDSVYNVALGSPGPIYRNVLIAGAKYAWGENLPEFALDYTFDFQSNKAVGKSDTTATDTISVPVGYDNTVMKHLIGIEGKQRFSNGIEYSLQYKVLLDNDLTDYSLTDPSQENLKNKIQHQINARFVFKILKILRNKTSLRVTTSDEVRNKKTRLQFKITDDANITLMPRKLNLMLKGDYSNKNDEEYQIDLGVRVPLETVVYGFEGELKYIITPKLSLAGMGRYEKSRDQNVGTGENYKLYYGGMRVTYLF